MAPLPAGPYVLEFNYTIDGLTHDAQFNCDTLGVTTPGQDPTTISMAARSEAATVTLQEAADDVWEAYRQMLPTVASCSSYTLWKGGVTNTVRTFVSGGVLTVPNGAGVGAYVPAQQMTLTFRSGSGRIARVVVMETYQAGNSKTPLNPAGAGAPNSFAGYALSGDSILCARDRSFLVQALNVSLGQNEATFEDRFRS